MITTPLPGAGVITISAARAGPRGRHISKRLFNACCFMVPVIQQKVDDSPRAEAGVRIRLAKRDGKKGFVPALLLASSGAGQAAKRAAAARTLSLIHI